MSTCIILNDISKPCDLMGGKRYFSSSLPVGCSYEHLQNLLQDQSYQRGCMSLSCEAFSSEALICHGTGNAWTFGRLGDSMQQSLHQTLSELTTTMADVCGQRLSLWAEPGLGCRTSMGHRVSMGHCYLSQVLSLSFSLPFLG